MEGKIPNFNVTFLLTNWELPTESNVVVEFQFWVVPFYITPPPHLLTLDKIIALEYLLVFFKKCRLKAYQNGQPLKETNMYEA